MVRDLENTRALKVVLYGLCVQFVEQRINTAREALEQAREASNDDTKSSAGDKYETSREMMQQEIDRNKRLLMDAEEHQRLLKAVHINQDSNGKARHGSLVFTDKGNFFISISAGQLHTDGEVFFAVSPASPIGRLLIDKSEGEKLTFNGNHYQLLRIV